MKLIVFIFAILLSGSIISQTEYVLKLTNQRKPDKVVYFRDGDQVAVYNNDGIEISGKMSIIDETYILVDSQQLDIHKIPIIINKKSAGFGAKTAGALVLAGGAGITIMGFIMLFTGISAGPPQAFFLVPASLVVDIIGIRVASAGLGIIVGKGKRYYLDLDWKAEIEKKQVTEAGL